jgi:hypothetical protein
MRTLQVTPAYENLAQIMMLIMIAFCSAIALLMLLRDVFAYDPPFLSYAVWGPIMGIAMSGILPLMRDALPVLQNLPAAAPAGPAREIAVQTFWKPVIGERSWLLMVVWILGFAISEVENAGTRRRQLTDKGFRDTIWPSYPVCAGSPMLAMIASRYILTWSGTAGWFSFLVLSALLTLVLSTWGTRWVIRAFASSEIDQRGRARVAPARQAAAPVNGFASPSGNGLGAVIVSPGSELVLSPTGLRQALSLHAMAMSRSNSLISNYEIPGERHLFILTEPDHTRTLVVLDSEVESSRTGFFRFESMR